jgi:hypothetical protein
MLEPLQQIVLAYNPSIYFMNYYEFLTVYGNLSSSNVSGFYNYS